MRFFGRTPTFAHGVHPPEHKDRTSGAAIAQFPFAPVLVVPLSQHIGKPAVSLVRDGQEVERGQVIARADGYMSVAMHAPVSGTVRRIGPVPTSKGTLVPGVYLEPFAASTQEIDEGTPCTPDDEASLILQRIQEAGIVGLGGAAFPTHVKLSIPDGKTIDTVIVNGAECEPYLTTDHRVMLEQADDIWMGLRFVRKATGAGRAVIALEANKADAAEALREALPDDLDVDVVVLPVKYPQGAEKMLIRALLGREVPSRGLPLDVGAVCINVATTAEIGRLLPHGRGIQERVVTVSGPGIVEAGNYRMAIGTPTRFVLETVGVEEDLSRVFLGGPMMGGALQSLDVPVTKGTSGIVGFTARETGQQMVQVEQPCIRCGRCVDACPLFLNPSELGLLAKVGRAAEAAADHQLMDCFECGSCTFVCPSKIPLVQRFRAAKAAVRRAS